jgi:hypothetical protein
MVGCRGGCHRRHQRSTSAMRRLYQFMNSEIERLIDK